MADTDNRTAAGQIGWWRTEGPNPNGQRLAPLNDAYDWSGWEPVVRVSEVLEVIARVRESWLGVDALSIGAVSACDEITSQLTGGE